MTGIDHARIVAEVLTGYTLPEWGLHGVAHWARVMENGRRLAATTGANLTVVELFALFHDSRRENDGHDFGHGGRGAELAAECRGRLFELPDAEFELLYRACERHTGGSTDPDITVLTCWDADRLDLGRVGMTPNPKYLCTPAGRSPETIEWCHTRSIQNHEPDFLAGWGVSRPNWL